MPIANDKYNTIMNRFGVIMALLFYATSVIMVIINTNSAKDLGDEKTQTIHIAHWHLEDGYREGIDKAIELYTELKATEGIKVRIIQSTVPVRGYRQWLLTQLISGNPADILGIMGSSQLQNQYFVPLSPYVGQVNSYNIGTPLEDIPWKDTFVDGMNSMIDPTYAEYFGIGTYFHVLRMFVNKDLLKKATGNDRMPRTFDEWIEDCRQLQEYGKTTSQPIISIGVRGLDKATLDTLFKQYFSQLNGNLCDEPSLFGSSKPGTPELLSWIAQGKIDRKRMFEAVDLTCELGRYFCEGFSSIDLEQTKFLFFSGNVGFFPEGTWNAWSMVNNSPFEVGVINIPVIGPGNRYFSDFTGRTSELGVDIGGRFGITKASKNPDLALDFLRFLKSYRINQLTMMDYCKWPPAVIKAEYKGLLEKFKPEEGDARLPLNPPFFIDKKSETKMLESLERIIVNHYPEPGKYFWSQFIDNMPYMISEASEAENSSERQFFELSAQCDGATVGLLDQAIDKESCRIRERGLQMDLENLVDRIRQRYLLKRGLDAMKELSARPEKQVK